MGPSNGAIKVTVPFAHKEAVLLTILRGKPVITVTNSFVFRHRTIGMPRRAIIRTTVWRMQVVTGIVAVNVGPKGPSNLDCGADHLHLETNVIDCKCLSCKLQLGEACPSFPTTRRQTPLPE